MKIELIINVAVSCINLISGICFGLSVSRGWALSPVISISVNILSVIVGIFFINVTTLKGVLLLNMFIGIVDVVMLLTYALNKIRLLKLSEKINVNT